jgi:hypothetical protein
MIQQTLFSFLHSKYVVTMAYFDIKKLNNRKYCIAMQIILFLTIKWNIPQSEEEP